MKLLAYEDRVQNLIRDIKAESGCTGTVALNKVHKLEQFLLTAILKNEFGDQKINPEHYVISLEVLRKELGNLNPSTDHSRLNPEAKPKSTLAVIRISKFNLFEVITVGSKNKHSNAPGHRSTIRIPDVIEFIKHTHPTHFERAQDAVKEFDLELLSKTTGNTKLEVDLIPIKTPLQIMNPSPNLDPGLFTDLYRIESRVITKQSEKLNQKQSIDNVVRYLPMYYNKQDTRYPGRRYYKGFNLQSSVTKQARVLALGPCIELDLENAVQAWRYHQALPIIQELHNQKSTQESNDPLWDAFEKELKINESVKYTRFYLDNKNEIRLALAKNVWETDTPTDENIHQIKQVLTALGYGSKLSNGQYLNEKTGQWNQTAIQELVPNALQRERLIKSKCIPMDPDAEFPVYWTLKDFAIEQQRMSKLIQKKFTSNPVVPWDDTQEKVQTAEKRILAKQQKQVDPSEDPAVVQKIKPTQLLAEMYYIYETEVMNLVKKTLRNLEPETRVLLWVHDCIYIENTLQDTTFEKLQSVLQSVYGDYCKLGRTWHGSQ